MSLPNIGLDLGFTHAPIKRLVFCLTTDDSGAANVISLSDAAVLANWQTQFNKYAHLADSSDKFVVSPVVRQFAKADVEPTYWEVEDYKVKMLNGYADITVNVLDPAPYIIANLKAFESESLSVFLVDENSLAIGIKSGTDLKPIPIKDGSFSVNFYSPRGYDAGSTNSITFRLSAGTDLNSLVGVQIATGDVYDDTAFYSLRDVSATIASPAVTGCTFAPTVDDIDPSAPATSIPVTGILYSEITFVDQADDSVISLDAAGSLSYTGGVYTVNEAALLTSGHTYTVKVSHPKYDVVFSNDCVIP